MPRKYSYFGDEDDWAESVVKNLERIYDRIDSKDEDKKQLRESIKRLLTEYDYSKNIPYSLLLEIIEAFPYSIDDDTFLLVDFCANKIIQSIRVLNADFIDDIRKQKIKQNLHQYAMYAVYFIAKKQTLEAEKREQKIQDSALGIIAHDVIPLYETRSSHVRKYVEGEKLLEDRRNRNLGDESDEYDDSNII